MVRPPLPTERISLDFAGEYSSEEFARLRQGLQPSCMEDKWNVEFEKPWLHLRRSWTGFCTFGLRLEPTPQGATVTDSWVTRDSNQYNSTSVEQDRAIARFVVDALMLGKFAEIPVPPGSHFDGLTRTIYEHALVGRIASQASLEFSRRATPVQRVSWWRRIVDRLRK